MNADKGLTVIKHFYFFIAALLIATLSQSNAMEKNTANIPPAKVLRKFTINQSSRALYLTENSILVSDYKKHSILDIHTGKEIKTIDNKYGYTSAMAMHPDRTKFAFSNHHKGIDPTSNKQQLTIYNAKTYEVEYDQCLGDKLSTIESLHFSPSDTFIALGRCHRHGPPVINYRKEGNTYKIINIKKANSEKLCYHNIYYPAIAFHPTQPQTMCLAWESTFTTDITTQEEQQLTTEKRYPLLDKKYYIFCAYNHNGTSIIKGKRDNVTAFNLHSRKEKYIAIPYANDSFKCMAIHPNNAILVTLSVFKVISYWNITTGKLIATTAFSGFSGYDGRTDSLSFSPSGENLLLVMPTNCAIIKIPFKALYKSVTEEECMLIHWLLKNYKYEQQNVIPHEIADELIRDLLAVSRYSPSNY